MRSISSALQRWAAASPCKWSGRDELLSGPMKNPAIQPWDQYKQNSLSVVGPCIRICTAKVKQLKKKVVSLLCKKIKCYIFYSPLCDWPNLIAPPPLMWNKSKQRRNRFSKLNNWLRIMFNILNEHNLYPKVPQLQQDFLWKKIIHILTSS